MKQKIQSTFVTSKKERMGYYSYFVGQNIMFIFVTLYLSLYFTTVLGIPAATVGIIFLIARTWDAINDPLLSILVEKSKIKSGKFKPWIKSVTILIPLFTILNFSFSSALIDLPVSLRTAYALIVYILWGMIYTISDAPAYALATVMTDNADERNNLISFAKFFGVLGLMFSMVISPVLVDKTNGNWTLIAIILSLIAFAFLSWINGAKERVTSNDHTPTLRDIMNVIFKNKYLVTIVITIIAINGLNFSMTITPYLTQYVFNDASLTAVLMAFSVLPMMLVAPMLPILIRRFGKNTIMKFAMLTTVILSSLTYVVGRGSFPIFLVLSILKALSTSPLLIITALYFADIIEYEFVKSGKRLEAVTFSIQTFTNKLISAVAGAVPMFILGLFGFIESTGTESVTQPDAVVNAIWSIYNIGPALGALIGLIIFVKYYDLDERKLEKLKSNVNTK